MWLSLSPDFLFYKMKHESGVPPTLDFLWFCVPRSERLPSNPGRGKKIKRPEQRTPSKEKGCWWQAHPGERVFAHQVRPGEKFNELRAIIKPQRSGSSVPQCPPERQTFWEAITLRAAGNPPGFITETACSIWSS